MSSWSVVIPNHHEGYIRWEEYLKNQEILEGNQTNGEETLLSGPAREGLALLQGLLICGSCGRRLTVRYKGNAGIYPLYTCIHLKREGLARTACMNIRCDLLDNAVAKRVLEILTTDQIQIALKALEEIETRNAAISRQWQMRIQRADYEAQLAQRRYEEVDPANRLVAATLEKRWNDALLKMEEIKEEYAELTNRNLLSLTPDQKKQILRLAQDFPRLWNAPTTQMKDRKRMLRLLIKDITVEKVSQARQVVLHLRWQGGACEDVWVALPPPMSDRVRYPAEMVDKVRQLANSLPDNSIAETLNREGILSATGKPFTGSMIRWIRHPHKILGPSKRMDEFTVNELMEKLGVSRYVVYYWIERRYIPARRINQGSPYWITLDVQKERELLDWVHNSSRIQAKPTTDSQSQLNEV
jgi:predicted DNA-binding transcriptional regulator AlpA